jgi:hypothetical protein
MIALPLAFLLVAQASEPFPANPDPASLRELHRFATCIVRLAPRRSAELIGSWPTHGEVRQFVDLQEDCLRQGVLRLSGFLLGGGMAEAFLRRQPGAFPLANRVSIDPTRPLQARSQFELIGLCTVQAAPNETQVLLETELASEAEAAAVRALTPALTRCVAQGQSARLNRAGLRALLALPAYRLVQYNAAPAAPGN